jgi:hypothetical protein
MNPQLLQVEEGRSGLIPNVGPTINAEQFNQFEVNAKETKKCHHRQLMSADAVEFCQL